MTKLLLEKGINVNGTDKVGRSALFTLLQYTPEENSFPSSSNKNKKDVLHSKETREDMVPVLVGNGLDVNLVDKCDNTALDGVCSSGQCLYLITSNHFSYVRVCISYYFMIVYNNDIHIYIYLYKNYVNRSHTKAFLT